MTDQRRRPIRVVQWTTGNIAREAIKAVLKRSDLELVGVYAWSPQKVGVDVGTLCALDEELGFAATNDVDELLSRDVDCVIYMPLHPDVAELQRILRAGVNVASSAEFITGCSLSDSDRAALDAAAHEGGVSMFGAGINPGFMQMMAAVTSAVTTDVQKASMTESFDVSLFVGDDNFAYAGWGRPKDDPGHVEDVLAGAQVFAEAVDGFARLMKVELDDITQTIEFAYATEDVVADGISIPAGHVGGIDMKWHGLVDGREVIGVYQRWIATNALDPAWTVESGYRLDIGGDPVITVKIDILPTEAHLADPSLSWLRPIGLRITAAPVVNAVPDVCNALPGIITYADLPLTVSPIQR